MKDSFQIALPCWAITERQCIAKLPVWLRFSTPVPIEIMP